MNGKLLKDLRKEKGMTQIALAKELGVTRSLIGMVETGKQDGGREFSKKVAEYFNVSLDYLEGLSDDRNGITKEKEALVSNFLKYLVETGIIKDENNIDKSTEELILAMVRKEIAKLKDGD
ncbi:MULTISPECIES: helix-turn-helix transcriptional regulator [Clostridium]|uniref:Putative transcriptional regulator n=1 Tax=Clostridium disporicum TaxID=84024 RepID=A0A174DCZ8_9CLOT|nr:MULTISPECIES: helix-turn-helix transcriptional regulator [Clostridium]MEE0726154.1 helix-turn-helix transcriptional regulator [Clostridium saudiense]CUO22219.1 putative transcriptional regulator [Clostridium disporicum]